MSRFERVVGWDSLCFDSKACKQEIGSQISPSGCVATSCSIVRDWLLIESEQRRCKGINDQLQLNQTMKQQLKAKKQKKLKRSRKTIQRQHATNAHLPYLA